MVVTLFPEEDGPGTDGLFRKDAAKADAAFTREGAEAGDTQWNVTFSPERTLAQAIYLSGHVASPALCSGLGTCGRCRVRVISAPRPEPVSLELRYFSPEEIALGWRLACKHRPAAGMRVELPAGTRRFSEVLADSAKIALVGRDSAPETGLPAGKSTLSGPPPGPLSDFQQPEAKRIADSAATLLAVDLGTTFLEWRLLGLFPQGIRTLWEGRAVNPQMGAGSDVVSRLSVAATREGKNRLSALTQEALRYLADHSAAVARSHGLPGDPPTLCLAANTAMTAITLGLDTKGLASAPYCLPYVGGQWEELPGLPRIWTPPQLSPFVGGDIAAGYAALALEPQHPPPTYPFLLADLGTNGEFLLALAPDRALAASVALGPALEGIGLSHGGAARPGNIRDFSLSPRGLEAHCLPDSAPAAARSDGALAARDSSLLQPGITGTGYLALLRILLASGAMDRQGRFTPDKCGPLKRFLSPVKANPEEEPRHGDWLPLPFALRLTARDVEEILKVKAAFSLGLHRLLDHSGLASRDLTRVCLAGALGSHVNKQALDDLGFFPPGMANRIKAVGNSSLDGAALLLRSPEIRPALNRWAAGVTTLDLASDPVFRQRFADQMRFAW